MQNSLKFFLPIITFVVFVFLPLGSLAQEDLNVVEPKPETFIEEEPESVEFVDPREIKEALRQISDLKKETKRVLKKAKKATAFANEVNELNTLLSEIDNFAGAIKNVPSGMTQRETLQDFYDAQLWETLNDVRTKIELPNELKFIEKDLKKLKKLVSTKNFSIKKIDLTLVQAKIVEIENAVSEARNYFNQGDFEDARESLQIIYEGAHPGEILGVLNQLRDINKWFKKIKPELRDEFHELLEPVYEAVNGDDFREANMMLGEINQELQRLFKNVQTKSVINEDIRQKIEKLEEKLQGKQQQIETEEKISPKPQSKSYQPYQPYTASIFGTIADWFKKIFSW